jgi:hypothetical protein
VASSFLFLVFCFCFLVSCYSRTSSPVARPSRSAGLGCGIPACHEFVVMDEHRSPKGTHEPTGAVVWREGERNPLEQARAQREGWIRYREGKSYLNPVTTYASDSTRS